MAEFLSSEGTQKLIELVKDGIAEAKQAASNADAKAVEADNKADTADTKATAADAKAIIAQNKADAADAKADTATTKAEAADAKAAAADTKAVTAGEKADAADAKAETANTTAEAAQTTAEQASTTAENAEKVAGEAKTTAESAVDTANKASKKADEAGTNASAAVSTANSAKTSAESAVKTAEDADNKADSAIDTAGTAKTAADRALSTANTANTQATTNAQAIARLDNEQDSQDARISALEDADQNFLPIENPEAKQSLVVKSEGMEPPAFALEDGMGSSARFWFEDLTLKGDNTINSVILPNAEVHTNKEDPTSNDQLTPKAYVDKQDAKNKQYVDDIVFKYVAESGSIKILLPDETTVTVEVVGTSNIHAGLQRHDGSYVLPVVVQAMADIFAVKPTGANLGVYFNGTLQKIQAGTQFTQGPEANTTFTIACVY